MKKYISRVICAIFAFVIVFSMCVCVYASSSKNIETIDSLITKKSELTDNYRAQMEKILTQLVNEKSLHNDGNFKDLQGQPDLVASYDLDGAYRVAVLEPLFLTITSEKQDISAAITDTIQWKIPIITDKGEPGLVVLLEEDNVLSYLGMSVGKATNTWKIQDDEIKQAAKTGLEFDGKVNSMQMIHSYLYNTTFVYFDGEKSDYLIPYSTYSEEIGLENGKIYTASEVLKKFNTCFDEKLITDNPSYNGGAPFRTNTMSPLFVAILFFFTIGSISLVVILRHKRKQNG